MMAACIVLSALCLSPAVLGQGSGRVKGKIRNMRGQSVAGASVTARLNGADLKTAKSGPKGEFVIEGLGAGTYNIVVDAYGYGIGIKYGVEVKDNKTIDLGERLILQVDRGSQVIVYGSVFFKDGTSVTAAKVEVEKVLSDGSTKKINTLYTNIYGEFNFKQPEGAAKYRMTVKYKDSTASKEIEVDSAAIYRLAISLDISRGEKPGTVNL